MGKQIDPLAGLRAARPLTGVYASIVGGHAIGGVGWKARDEMIQELYLEQAKARAEARKPTGLRAWASKHTKWFRKGRGTWKNIK